MNGRQKIEAALSLAGSPETAAVIGDWEVLVNDHWSELTAQPWWAPWQAAPERQVPWYRDVLRQTGQDWFPLPLGASRGDREHLSIDVRQGGIFWVDRQQQREVRLEQPRPSDGRWHYPPPPAPRTICEIDKLLPIPSVFDPEEVVQDGRSDLAGQLLAEFGEACYPIFRIESPVWGCVALWGFEGLLLKLGKRPDLVQYASERLLAYRIRRVQEAARLGAAAIVIEECLLDWISPAHYETIALPVLQRLTEAIRAAGLKSIHAFYGDPSSRWELLLASGADALALEGGPAGRGIDIAEAARIVRGRCALLGNLDAAGLLESGSPQQLRDEIARQIEAGRANGGRFIMSLGSPVTPSTPLERVRLYCDLVHELGCL